MEFFLVYTSLINFYSIFTNTQTFKSVSRKKFNRNPKFLCTASRKIIQNINMIKFIMDTKRNIKKN